MKKKLRLAVAGVLVAAGLAATAGAASFESSADKLKEVGLFQGGTAGYELDRAPTRAEAATMLVRLLGKEAEAKGLEYTAPFTDLDDWQKPYVQYLYTNKLANGASETAFEPEGKCTAQMYTTFLLRALGYSDAADGDFTYAGAVDYGKSLGLVDIANCDETNFLRDHVAAMSLTALHTGVKDGETDLLDKLVADGAVDQTKAADLQAFFKAYDAYVAVSDEMNATKMDMDMNISADVKMEGEPFMSLTMPVNLKADMDLEKMDQSKLALVGAVQMKLAAELVGEGEDSTMDMPMEMYYTNGWYYMNMQGEKMKMAMSFDDMMEQMGDMTQMPQQSEPICLIDSIETTGNKTVITYSPSGLTGMISSVLQQVGVAKEDIAMEIKDINSSLTLTDGKLTAMNMSAVLSMTVEGTTMDMSMKADYTIKALGDGVQITLPTDLDTYTDMGTMTEVEAPAAAA